MALDLAGINSQMVRVTISLQLDHGPPSGRDDNLLYSAYAEYKLLSAMQKTEHIAKKVTEMKALAIKFSDATERFPSQT